VTRERVRSRIDTIEAGYEFLLAFAAQGVRDDRESPVGGQLRDSLTKMWEAMNGLADALGGLVDDGTLRPPDAWRGVLETLSRDCSAAMAAVDLVRGQDSVSSQLVDNLNASIHLRAVLTDLFLVDEILARDR
jgi:hypothetical protein